MRAVVRILLFFLFISFLFNCPLDINGEETKKKSSKQKKSDLIFLPIIYYTPETRIAGGIGGIYYLNTSDSKLKKRPSSILMDLVYTQNKQLLIEFFPDLYLENGKYHLIGSIYYRNYSEKFYGIGNNALKENGEIYSFRVTRLDLSLFKKVQNRFFAGIQYEFEHNKVTEVEEGRQLDTLDIIGKEGGSASGLGAVFNWDNRDNIFFPRKGEFCQISAKFFHRVIGSNYNFNKFNLDFRKYFTFFSSHVLAFQGYINLLSGAPPFQMLSLMGGPYWMRGYYKGRYRDKNMVVLQMEYRIPVWWRLGLVGFLGSGDVADKIGNFKFRNFKYSGGWGIRYQINRKEGTNLRVDFGVGKQSFGVYVTVNEAF